MTSLSALARIRAFSTGVAQPIRAKRHRYLSSHPLVIAYVRMAGEPFSLWGALIGKDQRDPQWLFTPDPRNRDGQSAVFAELASILVARSNQSMANDLEPLQILVSNNTAASDLRRFGRVMRARYITDEVSYAGALLDLYAQSASAPGSALCIAATQALSIQRATGQSVFEDQNLASQLVWWTPSALDRINGSPTDFASTFESAAAAEELAMGNLTTPDSDRLFAPLVERYNKQRRNDSVTIDIEAELGAALRSQVEPIWNAIWLAHELLLAIPQARTAGDRWADDARQFAMQKDWLDRGGARRFVDSPMRAARVLSSWESSQADLICNTVIDDDLALLEVALDGKAVVGVVDSVTEVRRGRVRRPVIVLRCPPTETAVGAEMWLRNNPKVEGVVTRIVENPAGHFVHFEVTAGMRNNQMPTPKERISFIALDRSFFRKPKTPTEAPWTHTSCRPDDLQGGDDD